MAAPKVNNEGQKELDKLQQKFDDFNEEVKAKMPDPLGNTPVKDFEPQTKLSTKEIDRTDGIYLKPKRTISCKEPFNEAHRRDYEFRKEYVRFIAENHEIIGDSIATWTRPFPGIPAEEWDVPTNRVVIGPRYLAEQIAKKSYTRLRMDEAKPTSSEGGATFIGQMVAEQKIPRLSARPATGFNQKSQF